MPYYIKILQEVISYKDKHPTATWDQLADQVFKKYKLFLSGDALRKRVDRFLKAEERKTIEPEESIFPRT